MGLISYTTGDYDKDHRLHYITITANLTTLKSIINVTNEDYMVDFSVTNSIGTVLGYTSETIDSGYTESPKIVNIMQVNSILVNIDIIVGSYVKGYYQEDNQASNGSI